ncbi:hypothetical protein, partial [Salmonella enterica]|uniref:hypothetical protein n=1 Tax=Salmonella enterica TaxID=28901 RepID=UPI0021C4BEF2
PRFSGLDYDASVSEIWADRTTSGLLKIWWKFVDNGYNYGDRSDAGHQGANPITGSSPIEIPVNDSVVLVPVAHNGYSHASPGCHYTLNETAASFADVIATIPNGWTSWAGGTGGGSGGTGGGTTTPTETAGGWDAASAVNGATVSGAVATLAYDGPSGIFAAKRINPGEKKIFVMRVDEYAEDGSLGLIQQGANLARFTDGFAGVPGFLLAPFRGTNYI